MDERYVIFTISVTFFDSITALDSSLIFFIRKKSLCKPEISIFRLQQFLLGRFENCYCESMDGNSSFDSWAFPTFPDDTYSKSVEIQNNFEKIGNKLLWSRNFPSMFDVMRSVVNILLDLFSPLISEFCLYSFFLWNRWGYMYEVRENPYLPK